MKFLNNWTIALDLLPEYPEFRQDFRVVIDYALEESILECDDVRLTPEIKVLQRVDRTNNTLAVKFDLGRRYHKYEHHEQFPNGLPNPGFQKYYGGMVGQPRLIKNTLFSFLDWIDVDQQKGHPTILFNLAQRNGMEHEFPAYKEYWQF